MAKKTEEAPYEPKILTDEELLTALDDGARHRVDIKTLDERKDMIDADIIATLFSRGDVEVLGAPQGSWKIETKLTRTIDAGKLVAYGVDPQVIADSTNETPSSPYLKLYPKRTPKE
jgi:hypothetical protein